MPVSIPVSFRVIDLSFNRISGSKPNVVEWILSNGCRKLQHLSIKGNKVAGDLPEFDCPVLEFLDLSANNFSSGFPSFRDCSGLQYLDLSSNKFFGDVSPSAAGSSTARKCIRAAARSASLAPSRRSPKSTPMAVSAMPHAIQKTNNQRELDRCKGLVPPTNHFAAGSSYPVR